MSKDKNLYRLGRAILEPLEVTHLKPTEVFPANTVIPKDRTYLGHCIEAWLADKLGKNEHNPDFTYEYVYSYGANEIAHVVPNMRYLLDGNRTYTTGELIDIIVDNQYIMDLTLPDPGQFKGMVRNLLIPRCLTVYVTGRASDVLFRMLPGHPKDCTTTAVTYDLLELTRSQGNWFALKTPVEKFWNKIDCTLSIAKPSEGEQNVN